jgi:hypothetical protein
MRFPKMKPAAAIALAGMILVDAVTIGTAVGRTNTHKAYRHKHRIVTVAVTPDPEPVVYWGPSKCGLRYFGGPKGGLWPAPCPGR